MFKKKRPQFTDELKASGKSSFLVSTFGEGTARTISIVLEIVQILVLSVALVLLIRTFVVQPFSVRGASMEPTYLDREYLIIDEVSYRFREPVRGEVVVFRYPEDPREYFIKRIIGLPGETVIIERGLVRIESKDWPRGRTLEEPYVAGEKTLGNHRVTLADDQYFLLGDNRGASLDSRMFGPIEKEIIVGRAWFRGWPPQRVGTLEAPVYNL
jgi:signal peptidase I